MGKITFIVGGAKSGKSAYALSLADRRKKEVAFIATCEPLDKEMRQRIAQHKKTRPMHWQTFEEPKDVSGLLKKIGNRFDCIVIDCLTLWCSNLVLSGYSQNSIEEEAKNIITCLKTVKAISVIVSNELGLGIVPENKLARSFRDIAGRVNQIVADKADKVYFMISGIPMKVK